MSYGYEDFEDTINVRSGTVPIKNVDLLYYLASKNLLEYLVKVFPDKDYPNKRVWLFKRTVEVQDEINDFYCKPKKK